MDQKECDFYAKEYPQTWAELTQQLPHFASYTPQKQAGLLVRYFDHLGIYLTTILHQIKARWITTVLAEGDEQMPVRKIYHELGSHLSRQASILCTVWAAMREREKQLTEEAAHEARHDQSNYQ